MIAVFAVLTYLLNMHMQKRQQKEQKVTAPPQHAKWKRMSCNKNQILLPFLPHLEVSHNHSSILSFPVIMTYL